MFTRSGNSSEFDSVIAMEGTLSRPTADGDMAVDLHMMYLNSKTGHSYGKCTVTKDLLSKETIEAFHRFLELAENDFGNIAFGEGVITTATGGLQHTSTAENPAGKLNVPSLGGV
jgi:hypothetical protein